MYPTRLSEEFMNELGQFESPSYRIVGILGVGFEHSAYWLLKFCKIGR